MTKKCPVCQTELKGLKQPDGSTQYQCDCAGFSRTVIHIIPEPKPEPAAPALKEK
jgi:hypothetical protein